MRRAGGVLAVALAVVGLGILLAALRVNPYVYFAGYVILQYVVIATAWNILGGYAGYVNFGTPAFFAPGASRAGVPLPARAPAAGGADRGRGAGLGAAGPRHRLSHPAPARRVLLDRDPGSVHRGAGR